MGKCRSCEEHRETEKIKIYNPIDFNMVVDTPRLCEECEDNNTDNCHHCGKHIYHSDICTTDWHKTIPYDDDFESDEQRYDVISRFETIFFCNQCIQKLFPDNTWQEIIAKIKMMA